MDHAAIRLALCARVWVLCVLACACGSLAQGVRDSAGPVVTPISRRAVEEYGVMLAMDDEQRAAARELHLGYGSALRRATLDADARGLEWFEEARAGRLDPREHARLRWVMVRDYVACAEDLERSLFDDLRALLTPEQETRFARVAMSRRREHGLRFYLAAGDGIDLVRLAEEQKLHDKAGGDLAPALGEYAVELDRLLREKMNVLRKLYVEARPSDGSPDPEQTAAFADMFLSSLRIRDFNRKTARWIESLLPAPDGAAFAARFRRLAFPSVYAASAADRAIAFVRELPDLSADQRALLDAIDGPYRREATVLNERWAAAVDRSNEANERRIRAGAFTRVDQQEERSAALALSKAYLDRYTLDERTVKRVRDLLTPEQRRLLTERKIDWESNDRGFQSECDAEAAWREWDKEGGDG